MSRKRPLKREFEVPSPQGPARVDLAVGPQPVAVAVLGHSAGGDAHAPLLVALRDALVVADVAVALVDQPYRVAGRRLPDPAARLDEAMLAVVAAIGSGLAGVPLLLGGRSSGSRVGCRIARAAGAVGVIALGFPLTPPGRPSRSRADELDAGCPVLVVQGERDSFGGPDDVRRAAAGLPVTVHPVAGADHSFAARRADGRTTAECVEEVSRTATAWIRALLGTTN